MINLNKKFLELNRNIRDSQFPLNYKDGVKAYYGINKDGFFRLSFLSSKSPEIKGITKNISIVQGFSTENNYWTCFDLKNDSLLSVFCTFGEDLVSCILDEDDENVALTKLRARFNTWIALFRKTRTPLSPERAKGLYGELYFMKSYLINKYSPENSVMCWSGPDNLSKDFSINDTWYEAKTINVGATVAKISSIQQLSSNKTGKLIIIRVEEMSEAANEDDSNINNLCQFIISSISDIEIKDQFLLKLSQAGYDFSDDLGNKNYHVHMVEAYQVDNNFPSIRETDVKVDVVSNVSYDLILKMIKEFKVELDYYES